MNPADYRNGVGLEKRIQVALGTADADLVLKNARVLSVFTHELVEADIAIVDGFIAGVGQYDRAAQIVDLQGDCVVPGFINTHCHVESSMVSPDSYCREELRHGTTTLITDPHEIANVAGTEGVLYMLETAAALPINYFVQAPSCVPATPFEHAGAQLDAKAIESLLQVPGVLGLGEMMNYPGVLAGDAEVCLKLRAAQGRTVDGHAPALSGNALQAYVTSGIDTDHESTSFEEALNKLRAGVAVLVREGSACKDLEPIITGVVKHGVPTGLMAFCSDDKHIADIKREGTIRHAIKRAIALGLPAADAYCMASLHAARIYRLFDLGAVAPGYRADLVVVGELNAVDVKAVYKDGQRVDADSLPRAQRRGVGQGSVRIAPLTEADLALPTLDEFPAIRVKPGQVVTQKIVLSAREAMDGLQRGSLNKLAVIERHHATGNVGVGLLAGYGLSRGAIASTVGHDSHNLIVAGTNDRDMLLAVREAEAMHGGYVFVADGQVVGRVPLSVYGLMSEAEPDAFAAELDALIETAHRAGVPQDIEPFLTLSFLALPVIPEIRLTDAGLFDVTTFRFLYTGKG